MRERTLHPRAADSGRFDPVGAAYCPAMPATARPDTATGNRRPMRPADIAASAPTAGLMQTSSANLSGWIGSRLVQRKSKAAGRHS